MKISFILVATEFGPMIINRNDFKLEGKGGIGVSLALLETGAYSNETEDKLLGTLMFLLRKNRKQITIIDAGANLGAWSIPYGKMCEGWGNVLAFEPQERIFYALAGNIVINNLTNVRAFNAALGAKNSTIGVPFLDYTKSSNFGGLSLNGENDIGQNIDQGKTYSVPLKTIDSLDLKDVGLIKIDVEGMELEVITGAIKTIMKDRPVLIIEHWKSGVKNIECSLPGYKCVVSGIDVYAIHKDDIIWSQINLNEKRPPSSMEYDEIH